MFIYLIPRLMASSVNLLKVSEERVKIYVQKKNQYLSAAVCDGDQELDTDPYEFVEGDEEFSFADKEKKSGGEPGKRNKVSHFKASEFLCNFIINNSFTFHTCSLSGASCGAFLGRATETTRYSILLTLSMNQERKGWQTTWANIWLCMISIHVLIVIHTFPYSGLIADLIARWLGNLSNSYLRLHSSLILTQFCATICCDV